VFTTYVGVKEQTAFKTCPQATAMAHDYCVFELATYPCSIKAILGLEYTSLKGNKD